MIVDAHNHLGFRFDLKVSADDLIKRMDNEKVDKCVVFPFPPDWDNDYIVESIKKYPDRLIGFLGVDAWNSKSAEIIEKYVEKYGLMGIKLNPLRDSYHLAEHKLTDPIFKCAEKYNIPIICHGCDDVFNHPFQFEEMAKTFPNVNLIMAHGGFLWSRSLGLLVSKRNKNIIIETSIMFAEDVLNYVTAIGPERVIMGTDTPTHYFEIEKKKIEMVIKDKDIREKIMGKNILKILNL